MADHGIECGSGWSNGAPVGLRPLPTLTQEWARCHHWIVAALEHSAGTHDIADIEYGIAKGVYALWPGRECAAITEIHQFPRARYFHIFLAGGKLEELLEMVPSWRSFAMHAGCSKLTLCGRRGWERVLKKQGWKADLVCLHLPAPEEPEL